MKRKFSYDRQRQGWSKLYKAVATTLLVALLAGLIPPPLVNSTVTGLAEAALPPALANPAAALAEAATALLPPYQRPKPPV